MNKSIRGKRQKIASIIADARDEVKTPNKASLKNPSKPFTPANSRIVIVYMMI